MTRQSGPGASSLAAGLIGWIGLAMPIGTGAGLRTEPGPGAGRAIAEIRDRAGLFGADAIASAQGELERIARETGASIIIETVDSLEGEPADRVAISLARQSGIRGVFILIARKERKLEVLGSGHYKEHPDRRASQARSGTPSSRGSAGRTSTRGSSTVVAELARVMASARPAAADAPGAPVPEAPSGSRRARRPVVRGEDHRRFAAGRATRSG